MAAYLDHNATTPIRPEAAEAVTRAMQIGGNPSAVHESGRAARRIVEEAREAVAALVGADSSGVIFTSGGHRSECTRAEGPQTARASWPRPSSIPRS